ncbi:hypothetical protein [Paracoccus sp. (in: a-proteobacteria)]|nr:hypothetical protein [Paracoccus sp. (in: a-proteobacteria)]
MNRKLLGVVVVLAAVAAGIYFMMPPKSPIAGNPTVISETDVPSGSVNPEETVVNIEGAGGTEDPVRIEGQNLTPSPDCVRYDWNGTAWVCTARSAGR